MFNFFSNSPRIDGQYKILDKDFNHMKNVLRFKVGEQFLVSYNGQSDLCRLKEFTANEAICEIIEENFFDTSLPVSLYLFQGLLKGDKMELVAQKAVELGVDVIVPVEMSRSIVKLDDKKKIERQKRLQAICESAAKQSKRNSVPVVNEILSFNKALELANSLDLFLVPYENQEGMSSTISALAKMKNGDKVGILIGPEGGFEQAEIDKAIELNGISISLGKRILRAETASITALSMCMLYSEANLK